MADELAGIGVSPGVAAGPVVRMAALPVMPRDLPPVTDGAAAVVIAAGDAARRLCARPVWIRGFDHRIDIQDLGRRDLTDVPSARLAA